MPRRRPLAPVPLLLAMLLSGCLSGAGTSSPPDAATAITGGEIEVTSLDALPAAPGTAVPTAADPGLAKTPQTTAPVTAAAPAPATPAPAPDAAPDAAAAVPTTPKSEAQVSCEKKAGLWVQVGDTALKTCVKRTKDSGKRCTREADCESQCLARSGTCAPIKPLLGCNDVLQQNGARVTLCVN